MPPPTQYLLSQTSAAVSTGLPQLHKVDVARYYAFWPGFAVVSWPTDDQPERMVQLTKDIRAQAEKIRPVELQMWSSPAGLGYLNRL